MAIVSTKISPADQGRRMALADFEHAEGQEGKRYELGRGVIIVADVPNPPHLGMVTAVKFSLIGYAMAKPGIIYTVASGSECKILLSEFESERHPDLAIYKTPPPSRGSDVWWIWVPEIVLEVVSEGPVLRDYKEKLEEYLAFGVREYWIVDGRKEEFHVFTRRGGKWVKKTLRHAQVYRTPLLPGFKLKIAAIFEAAK